MPRVQPRTNVYGVFPVLACVILAAAIVATFLLGIKPYQRSEVPKDVGTANIRHFPKPETPSKAATAAEEKIPGLTEEGKEPKKEEPKPEVAPGDKEAPKGEGEKAGAEEKKEPGKEAAPKEPAAEPGKEAPKEPPKDDTKKEAGKPADEKK